MADGIRITNTSGTTQIDESYFNLVLIDKQTITISTPGPTNYDYSVAAGDVCVVGVAVSTHNFAVIAANASGGTWTYRLRFFLPVGAPGSCTFTIYAFGKPPTPTETVGLKVLNGSGQVVFHSQFKPMRIVGTAAGDAGFTGPSGRNLAVIIVGAILYSVSVFPSFVYLSKAYSVSGSTVSLIDASVASAPFAGFYRPGSYAVIDVTNY